VLDAPAPAGPPAAAPAPPCGWMPAASAAAFATARAAAAMAAVSGWPAADVPDGEGTIIGARETPPPRGVP
jgi:hypothetical protein